MEWYLKVMKENYANFSGRARRKEYWMFNLLYIVVLIVAMVLDFTIGTAGLLYIIVALVHVIPSFSVMVRRLHDVKKSGWFILISLIPIIGGIWFLILMCTDGDSSENAYGPSPKSVE